jgi:hypothetical protein
MRHDPGLAASPRLRCNERKLQAYLREKTFNS